MSTHLLKKILICLTLIALTNSFCHSQISDTTSKNISVVCNVYDENGQPLSNVIVVNKRTRTGAFGKSDGSFSLTCLRTDTLSVTSLGFYARDISFKDSTDKTDYKLKIYLDTRVYRLATVEVFAPRDLEKIQKDIDKLGYDESDYMLSGLNAAQSPITFLYQQFSKKERSKRLVAQLENEDLKRDLLKELFHHYVDYQIIELNDDQFDDFIDFLNVSDDFMKRSSQYDFLIYVRDRFRDYKTYARQKQKMREDDFNYDKD